MRPPINDETITVLRAALPEFEDHYLDLVDIYDEDLTPEIVLMELADFVANLVAGGNEVTLERCLSAVDDLAAGTEDGPELVTYSFLNELPLATRPTVAPLLGPVAAHLAERLFSGDEDLAGSRPAGGGSAGS